MTTHTSIFYKIDIWYTILRTALAMLLVTATAGPVVALHPLVRNFPRAEYKAGTQNWDITQDNNLEVFFANNEGLLSFDGTNWRTLPTIPM
jgi:hypothetical protein